MTVLLMNPNSCRETTQTMCRIAGGVLGDVPSGWTADAGPRLLTSPEALDAAAACVATVRVPADAQAVIVAAFGDPGAGALQRRIPVPVIGIGAAVERACGRAGARFAVATTTPALRRRIDTLMAAGRGGYLGCFLAEGDPVELMASEDTPDRGLLAEVERAALAGAERVIIGGGPLGAAAERLSQVTPVRLVNPLRAAAEEVLGRLVAAQTAHLA